MVFSAAGTQIVKKWYAQGNVALSKNPINTRTNSAVPKEYRHAMGTIMVKNDGIATLHQGKQEAN